jgi:anti-sigma B factor antagonist
MSLSDDFTTQSGSLRIRVEPGVTATVRLNGRVDIESSPDLRNRLHALLQASSSETILVDLADVPYIDTSGVATLIEGLKIARRHRKALCLQGLTGSVLHFFQVTNMLTLFKADERSAASQPSQVS